MDATDAVTGGAGRATLGRLWFGLLAAPAAWAVAELAGYVLVSRSCTPGPNGLEAYGVGRPGLALVALAALTALVAAAGLYTAYGSWRAVGAARPADDGAQQAASGSTEPWAHAAAPPWGRARFMARAGIATSALFLLGIVLFGIPPALVDACSRVR